jgi:pimeloyl-ACP methyl ester carboxylesterase
MITTALLLCLSVPARSALGVEGITPSSDGVPIHYRSFGEGEPALVFVHGWPSDQHIWDYQVPHFHSSYRVVTLDLAGHGRSARDRSCWSVPSFGKDVLAVITALGLKHVVLVGHGLGAMACLEATRAAPDRIMAVIAVESFRNVDWRMPPEKRELALDSFRSDFERAMRVLLRDYWFLPSESRWVEENIISKASAMPPDIAIGILRTTMTYDARPSLSDIKVPIVAINSVATWPMRPENARRYAPQFEALPVHDMGHFPMCTQPDKFNELLELALHKAGLESRDPSKPGRP